MSSKGKWLEPHRGGDRPLSVHLSHVCPLLNFFRYIYPNLSPWVVFRGHLVGLGDTWENFSKKFFFQIFFWGQRSNLVKNRKFCNWLEMVPNMLFWHETSFKVEKNWKIKFSKFFINVPPRPPGGHFGQNIKNFKFVWKWSQTCCFD